MASPILLISPNWLGDFIMALPALAVWRRENPDSSLVVLAKPAIAPLWKFVDGVSEVIPLPKGTKQTFQMGFELRKRKFDTAFLLPNSFRSALIAWLSGAKKRRGTGIHARRLLVNRPVRFSAEELQSLHQTREYLKILTGKTDSPLDAPTGFHPPPCSLISEKPTPDSPIIAIIPGAARGDSKRWTGFAAAAKLILAAKPNARFFICGAASESPLCEAVAEKIGPSAKNVAGKTKLAEFASLLASVSLVLCNDSGGMHIAAAAGTPLIAVFGITDPSKTGPVDPVARILQADGFPRSRTIARTDPVATAALAAISPELVASTALKILGK